MIYVSNNELNTSQTANTTTHHTRCLFVTNRQQLSRLLHLPLGDQHNFLTLRKITLFCQQINLKILHITLRLTYIHWLLFLFRLGLTKVLWWKGASSWVTTCWCSIHEVVTSIKAALNCFEVRYHNINDTVFNKVNP